MQASLKYQQIHSRKHDVTSLTTAAFNESVRKTIVRKLNMRET